MQGVDLSHADATGALFTGAILKGTIFSFTEISRSFMTNARFDLFKLPRKKLPKPRQHGASSRRLAFQVGNAALSQISGADEGEDSDNDNDDYDHEGDDVGECSDFLATMAEENAGDLAAVVASAMPEVVSVCKQANVHLKKAVEKTKTALDDEVCTKLVSVLD